MDCWIVWLENVWICKKLPNCLPKWLYCFAFPSAMNESFCCSTASSAFGVVSVQDFDHPDNCVVVSYCFIDLISGTDFPQSFKQVWNPLGFPRIYLVNKIVIACIIHIWSCVYR